MEKLTYSNFVKKQHVICISPGGVEYIAEDPYQEDKWDFFPKSNFTYLNDYGYSKEEIKDMRKMYREANKNLNLWKKGVRKVIKMAKQGPGAMNAIAYGYTGNGPKNEWEYFWKLYRTLNSVIIKIGETGKVPAITHYVDGSLDYSTEF